MQRSLFAVSGIALGTLVLATSVGCGAAAAQGVAGPVWPTTQWQVSTPEEQGIESAALANLIDFGKARSFDSLLIVRHGRIVLDAYYAPYAADIPHVINSATKSVTGTLTAIAIRDGLLDSLDHRMLDFFADRGPVDADDRKKAITIANLLDMTSGLDWKEPLDGRPDSVIEMALSPDWVKFILDRPMSNAPGETFNYNSGNSQLVSAIIAKLTGMSARDYAKTKLFAPLGITTSNWLQDPQGITIGGYDLSLLPRDMARIGYLYLRKGQWEDKQLLPAVWIDKVSHATLKMNLSSAPDLRYSSTFWALPDKQVYMAVGYHCEVILISSALDIVAVVTARDFCPFGKLADYIAGAVKSDVGLPADPVGENLLASKLQDISTERRIVAGAAPEIASAVSGKTYTFPANALNLKSLSLNFADPDPRYVLEIHNRDPTKPPFKLNGVLGTDGVYRKSEPTRIGIFATRGRWLDSRTFEIDRWLLGASEQQKWTLSFDGEMLRIAGKDMGGREVSIESSGLSTNPR